MKSAMRRKCSVVVKSFLVMFCCCYLPGCSSSETESISAAESVTFPAEFEDGETSWTRTSTISETDLKMLSGYFRQNSSLAEGPLTIGDPTLYTSRQGAKRFYWGRGGAKGPEWIYIQFEGRKATVLEGTGTPLSMAYSN